MADTLTPPQRSERMARVRGKDTRPEMKVRSIVHGMGYRYRLHRRSLPGSPDLVFPSRRAVIFVHGCFWHRHDDPRCKRARLPKSRPEFWLPKLEANRQRDARNKTALESSGWRVLELWECQLGERDQIEQKVKDFLGVR